MVLSLNKFVKNKTAEKVSVTLSPFLGFLAFLFPVLIMEGVELNQMGSFVNSIYENMIILPTIILLIIFGVILGTMGPRFWLLNGFLTIVIFPSVAMYDIFTSTTSHNLWPVEFFLYGLLSVPAIVGSFCGSKIARRIILK